MFFKFKEKKVWRQLREGSPGFSLKVKCGKSCFIKAEIKKNDDHVYSVHKVIDVNGKKFWEYQQETFRVKRENGNKYFNPPKLKTGKYPYSFVK